MYLVPTAAARASRRAHPKGKAFMSTETVRALLSQAPDDPLCDACLAFACGTSPPEMGVATETLVKSDRAFRRASSCGSWRRIVPTIFYHPDRRGGRGAAAS